MRLGFFPAAAGLAGAGALAAALAAGAGRAGELPAGPAPPAGEPFRLTRLASDAAGGGDGAISPAGDAFVISSRRTGDWELWLYELRTARWRQLTRSPGEDFEAQWSPDGRRLVFTSSRGGNKDLWTLSLDDGTQRRLTDSEYDEEYPHWSPDGATIVYTGGPWGENHFFVVAAGGGAPRQVTRTTGRAGACAFAPDGLALVCHRYTTGSGDLLRISLADGAEKVLTTGPEWDYKPTPSRDGRWIAFTRSHEGPSSIWVVPAEGGTARALARSGQSDRWPGWTAAGDRIFFHRVVERGTAVRRMERRTGRVTTLVGGEEMPLQASLDASGRIVVYCADRGARKGLRVRNLRTGETRSLGDTLRGACFPRLSPDGRTVAFGLRSAARWEIATIGVDGTGLRVWTEGRPGFGGMDTPVDWSPDGRYIAFDSDTRPFESDLYVLDTRDGSFRNVTQDAWFDEAPSWTPDGRALLYMSTRGGGWTWGLFRISLADGSVSTVARPSYEEKNFPRAGRDGGVVWAVRDSGGVGRLVELAPGAARGKTLRGAGKGVRWPSYTADGAAIIFTSEESHVEYWVAENPAGPGSPVVGAAPRAQGPSPPPAAPPRPRSPLAFAAPALLRGRVADVRSEWPARDRSPADKFRR